MCEVLIKATDAIHPDPVVDQRGCYKIGDPVVVFDTGHTWGAEEGLPTFWIITVTDRTAAQANAFIANHTDASGNIVTRRLWKFDINELTTADRNTLLTTGRLSKTWNQIKRIIFNKTTGQNPA